MTYEDHIEAVATVAQHFDQADRLEDFAAVATTHERYMTLLDAAEVFCDVAGIPHTQFKRDVDYRLGY